MNETLPELTLPLGALRLEALTTGNIDQANQLSVKPGQEKFIFPITYSLIIAPANPTTSWQRVAAIDDTVVGFIHANLDLDTTTPPEFRACVWRVYVDASHQGRGVGSFLIHAFADAASRAGLNQVTAIWEPGPDSPADAFHRIGFTDIGQTTYGETIGALATHA